MLTRAGTATPGSHRPHQQEQVGKDNPYLIFFVVTVCSIFCCSVGSIAGIDEDDGQTEGSYDRMISKVYCKDKVLNIELLAAGLATIDTRFCNESEFASEAWAKSGC